LSLSSQVAQVDRLQGEAVEELVFSSGAVDDLIDDGDESVLHPSGLFVLLSDIHGQGHQGAKGILNGDESLRGTAQGHEGTLRHAEGGHGNSPAAIHLQTGLGGCDEGQVSGVAVASQHVAREAALRAALANGHLLVPEHGLALCGLAVRAISLGGEHTAHEPIHEGVEVQG